MKNLIYFIMMMGILFLTSGCGDEVEEEIDTETSGEAQIQILQKIAENFSQSDKIVIVDENFSNLQLDAYDKPVYDKYGVWDRQERGLPMSLPEIEPYMEESVVYLTFDDGPDDIITPQILDVLKDEGVPATFFVLGTMVEKNPEVLKRIFREGHAIGNHSYNHVYKELYKSPWDFVSQFTKTDDIIMEYIGVRPLIIRAPGGTAGVFNEDYWDMIDACGYVAFDWNISTEDATAKTPNASTQINNVIKQMEDLAPHTVIILMHSKAGKDETVKALPELIHMLKDWGYKFGVITPMTPQI